MLEDDFEIGDPKDKDRNFITALARGLDVLRCKVAGYWYCARFEAVLDTIESDGYRLRAEYEERRKLLNNNDDRIFARDRLKPSHCEYRGSRRYP